MFEKRIKKHLIIDGMLCRHCVASVTEALESLDGVTAKVNLKKQSATVTLTHPIADDSKMLARCGRAAHICEANRNCTMKSNKNLKANRKESQLPLEIKRL